MWFLSLDWTIVITGILELRQKPKQEIGKKGIQEPKD